MAMVLFFDGECGFCSKSVVRVYQLDPHGAIEFAPLQGVLAGKLGLRKYAEKEGGSMVILRESDGEMYLKGDAWVVLGGALGGIWAILASAFSLFPKNARDWAYDLVAKNRYRLAGKGNACAMPEEGLRKRMRE
jgi:predicted DCC family thiol-disulfide oxidoreductase YuxK